MHQLIKKIFLVVFFSTTFIISQSTNSNKVNFSKLSIQDGLSNMYVNSIVQDKYGFMWFGTNDGLNRYDGKNIKVYKNDKVVQNSLSNNVIIKLFEDSRGNLWIATTNGLNRYNRKNDSFDIFNIKANTKKISRKYSNAIMDIKESKKGNIYIATAANGIQILNIPSGKFTKVVGDTITTKGFDFDVLLNIENNNNISFVYMNLNNLKQSLIYFNINTKEKKKYLIPTIERSTKDRSYRGMGISCSFKSKDGNVWLGTADGRILKFNRKTETFDKFEIMKGSVIMSIMEYDSSSLFIATNGSGLIKYNKKTREKTFYNSNGSNSLSTNNTTFVYKDRTGIIWVGTTSGIKRFDPFQTIFYTYKNNPNNHNSLSKNSVTSILKVKNEQNSFWVSTSNSLNKLNLNTGKSERYYVDSANKASNFIRTMVYSNDNSIWVGTKDGLKLFNTKTKIFKNELTAPKINTNINCLAKTSDNYLWIGTNQGLVKYNTITKNLKTFLFMDTTYTKEIFDELSRIRGKNNIIASIIKVGNNKDITKEFSIEKKRYALLVSIGERSWRDKNIIMDYGWVETNSNEKYWTFPNKKTMHIGGSTKNCIIIDAIEFEKGNYKLRYKSDDLHSYQNWNSPRPVDYEHWGIQLYEISEKEATFFKKNLDTKVSGNSIPGDIISSLYLDNEGLLWIGAYTKALATYDIANDKFETYKIDTNNKNNFISDKILSIFQDRNGLMWIATQNGLNSFDKKTKTFMRYTKEDGLPTNFICDILQDKKGNYWVSSFKGLSKFSLSQNNSLKSIVNYDLDDGLQGNEFLPLSKYITDDGRILFGGKKGLNSFYPKDTNPYAPEIIVKNFELFNKSVFPGDVDSPLEKAIYATDELNLNYDQNIFSFEFQAMHFSRPKKNLYSYKLDGVDKDWITGQRNYVSYTNLDPGKYTFNIKASNSFGIWNKKSKSILINISSPWWQTWWAYLSYAVLFLVGFIAFDKLRKRKILNKEREKAQIEQAELRAAAAEAQSKLMQVENDRKTKELEEARELQLSMLPKELPNLPHLDIAVSMQTATEVGGDYYDFHIGMDGTLTAVIGDATGHGLNAGTVVTATKSLFNTHANNPDILFTFSEMTRVLKGMKLRMLAMCLSMVKIKGNQLTISSAGIPPALIYRNNTKEIEEFLIKGMPLGVMKGFPYEVRTTEIFDGDIILLMSDGFPELFNKDEEMFGYDKVKSTFNEVTDKEPDEIIEHLKNTGSMWTEDTPPDDDVTFVVIKIKK